MLHTNQTLNIDANICLLQLEPKIRQNKSALRYHQPLWGREGVQQQRKGRTWFCYHLQAFWYKTVHFYLSCPHLKMIKYIQKSKLLQNQCPALAAPIHCHTSWCLLGLIHIKNIFLLKIRVLKHPACDFYTYFPIQNF